MNADLLKLTSNTGQVLVWDDQHQCYRTREGGTINWSKYRWCDEEWADDPMVLPRSLIGIRKERGIA